MVYGAAHMANPKTDAQLRAEYEALDRNVAVRRAIEESHGQRPAYRAVLLEERHAVLLEMLARGLLPSIPVQRDSPPPRARAVLREPTRGMGSILANLTRRPVSVGEVNDVLEACRIDRARLREEPGTGYRFVDRLDPEQSLEDWPRALVRVERVSDLTVGEWLARCERATGTEFRLVDGWADAGAGRRA